MSERLEGPYYDRRSRDHPRVPRWQGHLGELLLLTRALPPLATLLAAALEGDPQALIQLASAPEHEASELEIAVAIGRVGPALAVRAIERGVEGPAVAGWQRALRLSAAHRVRLEVSLTRLGAALDEARVRYAPIKGMGMVSRLYGGPEERPTSDLDILVLPQDLEPARRALCRAGWRAAYQGRRAESYLQDEGYAWVAEDENDLLLELHHRLWGSLPSETGRVMLERSTEDIQDSVLGALGRQLQSQDTFIIAATHIWLTPVPRPLLYWWELHRIATAMTPAEVDGTVAKVMEIDQPLLVGCAAAITAELWPHPHTAAIAHQLLAELRSPERLAAALLGRWRPDLCSYVPLFLASRLAGRPARSGWRGVARRVWVHPWFVEQTTPDSWSWWARRLRHLSATLHLVPITHWLDRKLDHNLGHKQ